ncbi:MAG TPA: ABC transporter permease [Acidimicrobiales bacterium]|nr:ABC transporter permease [Acidimicrobiales bacterium]
MRTLLILDFILPGSIVQAVSFGATTAGTALALDIEDGFFDRLMVSPVSRVPILLGRLGGAAVIAAGKAIILILIFLACGARIKSGLGGAVIVTLTASLLVLAIGGLAQSMAIKTRSQEAVGATFPLIFVTIFHVVCFFPNRAYGWLVSSFSREQSHYLDR